MHTVKRLSREREQWSNMVFINSDGMLVKRPLLVTDSKSVPGFKEELWSEELL